MFSFPSIAKASPNRPVGYAVYKCPFSCKFCLSKGGNWAIGSFVLTLLFRSGPSYVSRLIISVVINSIYRNSVIRWVAHVLKEFLNIKPFGVDRDSPSAIIMITIGVWIKDSLLHVGPNAVDAHAAQAVLDMPAITAAAFDFPSFQFVCCSRVDFPAVANALPINLPPLIVVAGLYRHENTKGLTRKIGSVWSRLAVALTTTARDSCAAKIRHRAITCFSAIAKTFPYDRTASFPIFSGFNKNKKTKAFAGKIEWLHLRRLT